MTFRPLLIAALIAIPFYSRAEDPYVYYPSTTVPSASPTAVVTSTTAALAALGAAEAQGVAPGPEQLNSLVAPVALYPDPLLSQILIASTYPLEIVQAAQWLAQHAALKDQALTTAAAQENWDPSVQALVPFPDVLKRLAQDVSWTTNLGNAFLANQSAVMDAVQRMRLKAQEAGKLTTSPQEKIVSTMDSGRRVIEIQPANPEVIYVPVYNPQWIWGAPYPYYPYPVWDYPVVMPVGFFFFWGRPVWCSHYYVGWHSWGNWGWHPYWGQRTVIVNNVFIRENHLNVYHSPPGFAGEGRVAWQHNPYHREGVPYHSRVVRERFYPAAPRQAGLENWHAPVADFSRARLPVNPRGLDARHVQDQLRESSARANAYGGGERLGNRQIVPTGYNRNHSAFGGMEQGRAARTHSARGYSSLGRGDSTASTGASPGGNAAGTRGEGGHGGGEGSGGPGAGRGWGGGGRR